MRTLALTVAYDGTEWAGFQRQPDRATVQGALEEALRAVFQHPVTLAAAGRTDAGVHALGQVVSFRTGNPIPLERIAWVVNRYLPESILVRRAEARPESFHARGTAILRRYWYAVQVTRRPDPFRGRFCWQIPDTLDLPAMAAAILPLRGTHDFAAFCHEGHPRGTMRTLRRAAVRVWQGRVIIDLAANAFLHQMVRLIAANLVLVGRGERPVEWLAEVLHSRNRHLAGVAAPPCGLCFMHTGYPVTVIPPAWWPRGELHDEELSGEDAGC